MLRGNGQHLEGHGRGREHLVGPFGAESLTPDVQKGGDGQEKSEHPPSYSSSVIH